MKIYLGADHRGFELKNFLLNYLKENNYDAVDCGAVNFEQSDDYPDFAKNVGEKVAQDKEGVGVLICGSGAGITIAANKINGIRCSLGLNEEQIKAGKKDDDINILGLASDYISKEEAKKILDAFIKTNYDPSERHERRLQKIKNLE